MARAERLVFILRLYRAFTYLVQSIYGDRFPDENLCVLCLSAPFLPDVGMYYTASSSIPLPVSFPWLMLVKIQMVTPLSFRLGCRC
jgi:hypothetical protein